MKLQGFIEGRFYFSFDNVITAFSFIYQYLHPGRQHFNHTAANCEVIKLAFVVTFLATNCNSAWNSDRNKRLVSVEYRNWTVSRRHHDLIDVLIKLDAG